MVGVGSSGYAICASEVTTGGNLTFSDPDEVLRAFTCDRHYVVLTDPRPLTDADIDELNRRFDAAMG